MHMCAYVTGTGLDATTPTGIYINPRRRRAWPRAPAQVLRELLAAHRGQRDPIRLKCGANYQNAGWRAAGEGRRL